jgi:hypothetical protein
LCLYRYESGMGVPPEELLPWVQCQIDAVTGTETKDSTSTHDRRFSAFGSP